MDDDRQDLTVDARSSGASGAVERPARPLLDPLDRLVRLIGDDGPSLALMAGLSIIASGTAVFGHIVIADDWRHVMQPGFNIDIALSSGRWLHALTIALLGADLVAPAVTLAAMLALWWVGLVAVGRSAGLDQTGRFLLLAVFTFNPLLAAFIGFETNHIAGGLSVLFCLMSGLTALRLADRVAPDTPGTVFRVADAPGVLVPMALFAAGAAGFQQFAVLMPMAVATVWGARLMRGEAVTLAGALRRAWIVLAVMLGGLALYALSVVVVLAVAGAETAGGVYALEGGYAVRDFQAVAAFRRFASHLVQFLFLPQAGVPLIAKLLVLAALGIVALHAFRALASGERRLAGIIVLGLVAGLILLPWMLGLIRIASPYYYRALAPVALSWA
ncbi:MAG: glucosyltransferase domain-containing protein, partial [Pseudomonadota bacterium]